MDTHKADVVKRQIQCVEQKAFECAWELADTKRKAVPEDTESKHGTCCGEKLDNKPGLAFVHVAMGDSLLFNSGDSNHCGCGSCPPSVLPGV